MDDKRHQQPDLSEGQPLTPPSKSDVEDLKKDSNVREALQQTSSKSTATRPPIPSSQKVWLAAWIFILLALAVIYYLSRTGFFDFAGVYRSLLQRIDVGVMAILSVL